MKNWKEIKRNTFIEHLIQCSWQHSVYRSPGVLSAYLSLTSSSGRSVMSNVEVDTVVRFSFEVLLVFSDVLLSSFWTSACSKQVWLFSNQYFLESLNLCNFLCTETLGLLHKCYWRFNILFISFPRNFLILYNHLHFIKIFSSFRPFWIYNTLNDLFT